MSKEPAMFQVTDSSATMHYPTRVHEIILNGKVERITFNHGEPTLLPFEKAAKFQREGFTMLSEDGTELKRPSDTPPVVQLSIKSSEVVARLEELTQEALFLRASILIGGEKFGKNSNKKDMIAFLIEHNEKLGIAAALEPGMEQQGDEDNLDEIDFNQKAA